MSDSLPIAFGSPVCRTVDGTTHTFPKLKRKQIGVLFAKWAAEDRARLVRTLAEVSADVTTRLKALADFDDRSTTVSYGYGCLFEFSRAREVIRESMVTVDKAATDEAADDLPFTSDEIVELACLIVGMRPKGKSADPTPAPLATGS
jgi:hypothetical protein